MEVHNIINETKQNTIWELEGAIPYVDKWFMMSSPVYPLTIIFFYLVYVYVGPRVMKSRPAFTLHNVLIVYNIVQVLYSIFLVNLGMKLLLPNGMIDRTCLYDDGTIMKDIVIQNHFYYLAKVSELLDTVFFILRKKQNQVTFLHVYHHASMVFASWAHLKFEPTYLLVFMATINSIIHVIMYAYYFLAAFPSLTKHLWWKKYITFLQQVQFVAILVNTVVNMIFGSCPPSIILLSSGLINTSFFLYLFNDFYNRSYSKKTQQSNEAKLKAN